MNDRQTNQLLLEHHRLDFSSAVNELAIQAGVLAFMHLSCASMSLIENQMGIIKRRLEQLRATILTNDNCRHLNFDPQLIT